MPAGSVGVVEGFMLANVDSVDITVRGVGGHGAWPHKTKDPVVLAGIRERIRTALGEGTFQQALPQFTPTLDEAERDMRDPERNARGSTSAAFENALAAGMRR